MDDTNLLYPTSIIDLFPETIVKDWMNKGKEVIFKKGEIISKAKSLSHYIYLIKEGNAHVFHIHGDGKECVIDILSKGDFIHLFDIFSERDSEVFAKALTDVKRNKRSC